MALHGRGARRTGPLLASARAGDPELWLSRSCTRYGTPVHRWCRPLGGAQMLERGVPPRTWRPPLHGDVATCHAWACCCGCSRRSTARPSQRAIARSRCTPSRAARSPCSPARSPTSSKSPGQPQRARRAGGQGSCAFRASRLRRPHGRAHEGAARRGRSHAGASSSSSSTSRGRWCRLTSRRADLGELARRRGALHEGERGERGREVGSTPRARCGGALRRRASCARW